jgi:hypothetical protein
MYVSFFLTAFVPNVFTSSCDKYVASYIWDAPRNKYRLLVKRPLKLTIYMQIEMGSTFFVKLSKINFYENLFQRVLEFHTF